MYPASLCLFCPVFLAGLLAFCLSFFLAFCGSFLLSFFVSFLTFLLACLLLSVFLAFLLAFFLSAPARSTRLAEKRWKSFRTKAPHFVKRTMGDIGSLSLSSSSARSTRQQESALVHGKTLCRDLGRVSRCFAVLHGVSRCLTHARLSLLFSLLEHFVGLVVRQAPCEDWRCHQGTPGAFMLACLLACLLVCSFSGCRVGHQIRHTINI